jgi:hypothetical protein
LKSRSQLRATDDGDVLAVSWEAFQRWFKDAWEPGDHVALIGPTKSGKTTTAVQLCNLRPWVLALDVKGGDSSLSRSRWPRITKWPPPGTLYDKMEKGEPVRLIVGSVTRGSAAMAQRKALMQQVLEDVWQQGNWTLYVDELQLLADPRMSTGLGIRVEEFLIAARDAGISVVSSYQAPRRTPRAASDQAVWLVVYLTRDVDIVNRLAEMSGRPRAEIRGAVRGLRRPCILVIGQDPEAPIIVTRPERLPG